MLRIALQGLRPVKAELVCNYDLSSCFARAEFGLSQALKLLDHEKLHVRTWSEGHGNPLTEEISFYVMLFCLRQ